MGRRLDWEEETRHGDFTVDDICLMGFHLPENSTGLVDEFFSCFSRGPFDWNRIEVPVPHTGTGIIPVFPLVGNGCLTLHLLRIAPGSCDW